MKILRITTVPISLKLLLTGQMKFMHEHGHEVLMVSADGPEVATVKRFEGCPHRIIPFTRQITPFIDLKCLWLLIQLIRKEKPDIIHTHTPKAGLLGMLAGKIASVPVRIHTVAGLPLMTASGLKLPLLRFIERLTYWAAHEVWPNSQSIYQFIKKNGFTTSEKLSIIGEGSSNGIDLEQFSDERINPQSIGRIKEKVDYHEDLFYCLAVGRIVKDKGIEELVNAFIEVFKSKPNLRLVLVGEIEEEREEENLSSQIKQKIIEHPAIYSVGWSNKVEVYLSICDLLIHASHREGFPNVLLQAGAMQCPIICSNIPGNIDIVTNQKTGLYFKVGNTNDLENKINFALDNPQIIKLFAKSLKEIIREKYARVTIHNMIYHKYLTLLRNRTN